MRGAPTPTKSTPARKPSLDFDLFSPLMERGRPAAKLFVLGSWPIYHLDEDPETIDNVNQS
jgi:hypothetical protein